MLWTFVPFVISNVACALAPNTIVLVVFRLLAGTFGSSPLANAGGSVSDMWAPHERSLATSLYSAGPWFGPSTYFIPLVCIYKSPKPLAVFGPLVGVSVLFDLLSTIYQRGYRAASCRVLLVGGSTSVW